MDRSVYDQEYVDQLTKENESLEWYEHAVDNGQGINSDDVRELTEEVRRLTKELASIQVDRDELKAQLKQPLTQQEADRAAAQMKAAILEAENVLLREALAFNQTFLREHCNQNDEYVQSVTKQTEQALSATPRTAKNIGELSDGYHTFNELYEFRKVYNAALFNEWAAQGKYDVHKSLRHYDGEECFGGGWFIVVAVLPGGQISNHYEMKDWDLFQVAETDKALYEFDGHSGNDVVDRLKSLPVPKTTAVAKVLEAVKDLRKMHKAGYSSFCFDDKENDKPCGVCKAYRELEVDE